MRSSGVSFALARRSKELLADGEWHDYEQVLRELIKVVPPGPAIRVAERNRINALPPERRRGEDGKPTPRAAPNRRSSSVEAQVRTGARSIARAFLKNREVFEVDREGAPGDSVAAREINRQRRIRMVGEHSALRGDPYRQARDRLDYENLQLRGQLDRFIAYLKDHGHAEAVDQLIAGPELGQ